MKSTDKVNIGIPTPKELNINELHLTKPLFYSTPSELRDNLSVFP
jgi:hypothetical protein